MYEMKKSRSLRIYAETPDLEEQTPRSKSARLFGEPLKSRQRPSFSERRSSHENEDFASGDNYGQKTSSERFFDVEISGALNADGAFRSRSQRVYLSELPDNLQSQIEQESERFSIGSPIEGSLEHAKSFSKYTDKKLDEVGDESTKDTKEEKVFETGKGARKKKVVAPRQSVPYLKLYKYADPIDYLLMVLGTVAALIDGLMWPAIAFIQSHLLNRFASLARTDPDLAYTKVASVRCFPSHYQINHYSYRQREKLDVFSLTLPELSYTSNIHLQPVSGTDIWMGVMTDVIAFHDQGGTVNCHRQSRIGYDSSLI